MATSPQELLEGLTPALLNPPAPGPVSVRKRARILIVDSLVSNRRSLRGMLGELDYELVEASSSSDAVAAMSVDRTDLVLLDSAIPEPGAIEFCRMLKKSAATKFLPVFMTAAADDLELEVRAIEAGADEFLIAPLRPRALRARIEAGLRHKAAIDSLDNSETVLFSLAQSVEGRDPLLGQHCQRLSYMAAAMGVALGLAPDDILALQRGGYLHDIGKVAIPDRVLLKVGPLNAEEWQWMKTHTERGERICRGVRSLAPVLPIIRNHHERWDGSGYPDGLKGEQIPLLARILQIADIYDALTTVRPYKGALGSEEAIDILKEEARKGWRDPNLVSKFADILPALAVPANGDASGLSLHALARVVASHRKTA
ncbi:MAG TPA: HD domain-containing phosphohydrolase [Bryobacteraceae bacterium]|jgi:putative two-component system response regulator|nr:HD domain-containing phosphohydrolase [Bryobacteraceae bacterium]